MASLSGQFDESISAAADPLAPSARAWSLPIGAIPLGRWSPLGGADGVLVRLHVSLAVALAVSIVGSLHVRTLTAGVALATYLVSLLVHELAHLAAARGSRFALPAGLDPIVLGPLGGLRVARLPADPRDRVFVAMAGPMASLALVVIGFSSLAISQLPGGDPLLAVSASHVYVDLVNGAEPMTPFSVTLARLLIAVNLPLFLLNLLPASPFDGGVALRSWLEVLIGPRAAHEATFFFALLLGASLLGAGWAVVLAADLSPMVGVALAVTAVVIGFGAWSDATHGRILPLVSQDASSEFGESVDDDQLIQELLATTDEVGEHDPLPAADWDETQIDEGHVDAILAKVHEGGLTGLTANERAILERASQRYRQRRT